MLANSFIILQALLFNVAVFECYYASCFSRNCGSNRPVSAAPVLNFFALVFRYRAGSSFIIDLTFICYYICMNHGSTLIQNLINSLFSLAVF